MEILEVIMKVHKMVGFLLTVLIVFQAPAMSYDKLKSHFSGNKNNGAPEDVIVNHVGLIQELKKRNESRNQIIATNITKSNGLTQTEAHFKIHKKELLDYFVKYPWLLSSLEKIVAQEKINEQAYYIFYHSQVARLGVIQDFLKELHQLIHMEKIYDFVFLRNPYELPLKEHASNFLDKTDFDTTSDSDMDVRRRLLSVNLALFGNITAVSCLECSIDFFFRNTNISAPQPFALLKKIFQDLGLDVESFTQLVQLADDLESKHGVLLQIFVPKDKIDECAYLSKPFGRPVDKPILPDYFDRVKKRHTRLGPILDYYKSHPEKIKDLDRLQARILLDRNMMLNPKSGIKIIRYGALPAKINQEYKQKVKKIAINAVKKMIKDGKELKPVNPDMGKPPLQRLQEMRARL